MRRFNRAMPFALASASGLAAMALIQVYLTGMAQPAAPLERMVVLARPVSEARPIKPDDLRLVEVPHRPPGAFADPHELVGRLPLVAIPIGQPVLSSHLGTAGSVPGLWTQVTAGKRAITISLDELFGAGGGLKPGVSVDVIGVTHNGGAFASRTVAQNVPVLAVAEDAREGRTDAHQQVVKSVTLLVAPGQAEAITLAGEEGRLRLSLRAANDHHIVRLAGAQRAPRHKPPAAPARQAPPPARHVPPPPSYIPPPPSYIPPRALARPAPPPRPPVPQGIEVIQGTHSEVVHP